ncbi:MAG: type II secretion system F family protein [Candidatus Marinimicrobia bacterium]|nr:type II secretion system F family protein [Candidatus Neomarinimicrobiota bacterium]
MKTFNYVAIDQYGKRTKGSMSDLSIEDAKRSVKNKGLKLLELNEKISKSKNRLNFSGLQLNSANIKQNTLVRFFRQLATLLNAGIQLIDALQIIELQMRLQDKVFAKILSEITKNVKAGVPFSSTLKEHKKIFSSMVTSMIKAAEVSGGLNTIVEHISTFIEKDAETKRKIKSATNYPKFVGGFFFLILIGIIFGLLPKFEDIFAGLGAELPTPTKIILLTSNFIKENIIIAVLTCIGFFVAFKAYKNTPSGGILIDRQMLKFPIVGKLIRHAILVRFTLTLSILLNSGAGLIESLKIAAQTAENAYVDDIIVSLCEHVSGGESLGKMLGQYPEIFPPLESNMVEIGERSGSLAIMLDKVSEFNEMEFNNKVENLSKILEPVIMGFLGIIATVLVLGLYLPIFKMSGSIH